MFSRRRVWFTALNAVQRPTRWIVALLAAAIYLKFFIMLTFFQQFSHIFYWFYSIWKDGLRCTARGGVSCMWASCRNASLIITATASWPFVLCIFHSPRFLLISIFISFQFFSSKWFQSRVQQHLALGV